MKEQKELSSGTEAEVTGGTRLRKEEFGVTCPKCGSSDIRFSLVSLTPGKETIMMTCGNCGYFSSTGFSSSDDHSLQ